MSLFSTWIRQIKAVKLEVSTFKGPSYPGEANNLPFTGCIVSLKEECLCLWPPQPSVRISKPVLLEEFNPVQERLFPQSLSPLPVFFGSKHRIKTLNRSLGCCGTFWFSCPEMPLSVQAEMSLVTCCMNNNDIAKWSSATNREFWGSPASWPASLAKSTQALIEITCFSHLV